MLTIKLGYWKNIMAGESMRKARELMKKTGCTLSQGLKKAWKEIKEMVNNISLSYKEFKAKLYIKNHNRVNTYDVKGENTEDLMENALEKIAEVKGKEFYRNMFKWFVRKYDSAIEMLEEKKKYTFMDGLWCIME